MLCLIDGLFLKLKLRSFSALVFQHTVILFLLADSCRAGVGPSQTVVALVGEDVILPCHLDPALDAVSKDVEWGRPDLEPRFVHVWYEGQNYLVNQNPSYKGRTSVSIEKLKRGDLSLRLSALKLSDNGVYRCYFPSQSKESTVELVVGSVSSPVIAGTKSNSSAVVLQCESTGWYPEPEVFWLDSEGNFLSAGPAETVRGPDGLYSVSSTVAVEKSHSNSFTCRVQQKKISQIREINIQISADYIVAMSSFHIRISIIVAVFLIFTVAAVFVVWKLRYNQAKDTKAEAEEREREQLLAHRKKMEDLEKEKVKLEERLQGKEEDQKYLEEAVKMLTEQSKDLENQRDQLGHLGDDVMKNMDDIENKMKSVEEKAERNPPPTQEYCDMKDITLQAKGHLRDRKLEAEQFYQTAGTLQNKTNCLLNTMTERKKEVENQREKIREQLEEIQRKLQSERKQET